MDIDQRLIKDYFKTCRTENVQHIKTRIRESCITLLTSNRITDPELLQYLADYDISAPRTHGGDRDAPVADINDESNMMGYDYRGSLRIYKR